MGDLFLKHTGTSGSGESTYQVYDAEDRLSLNKPLGECLNPLVALRNQKRITDERLAELGSRVEVFQMNINRPWVQELVDALKVERERNHELEAERVVREVSDE